MRTRRRDWRSSIRDTLRIGEKCRPDKLLETAMVGKAKNLLIHCQFSIWGMDTKRADFHDYTNPLKSGKEWGFFALPGCSKYDAKIREGYRIDECCWAAMWAQRITCIFSAAGRYAFPICIVASHVQTGCFYLIFAAG